MSDNVDKKDNHWSTVKSLLPYLWIKGRADLKVRVILALLFLVTAKLIGVYIPFLFKDAVEILSGEQEISTSFLFLATPVSLIIGSGISRILGLIFGE